MVNVHVIATHEEFTQACQSIQQGQGPLAIDAERASGFTYSQRAFLIQIHRRDAGTFLFDAPAIGDLTELFALHQNEEWVLHAASQDLACLREVGISPQKIFDTELSARLLGMQRVGLGAVVEELLGVHLAKEHSAADWSTRPLPEAWLTYAALDVELLVDLRDALEQRLIDENKLPWALEEFQATIDKPQKAPVAEPWRKLSGLHTLRSPRQLATARSLWQRRDRIAQDKDVSPGRLIPDSSIVAACKKTFRSKSELASYKEFSGRASRSMLDQWWLALQEGYAVEDLPAMRVPSETLPPPRAWADKKPDALERLTQAKAKLHTRAEELTMPVENLLTPSILREIAWSPPDVISVVTISDALRAQGARNWQISETCALISNAFVEASQVSAQNSSSIL